MTKAFDYYTKAIALNPNEPVYYHNFGTTVFLFRKDAREHYQINEQQVFDKALALYHEAMKLSPNDFPLASDVAQTFYGIRPSRPEDALRAWTNAFNLANDDIEREGVHTHFARVKLHAGRFDEARLHLNTVTNEMYAELKRRLTRSLKDEEAKAKETNAPPVEAAKPRARRTASPKRLSRVEFHHAEQAGTSQPVRAAFPLVEERGGGGCCPYPDFSDEPDVSTN